MNIEMLLAQPIFQSVGWALVHFIWQGAFVAVIFAATRTLLATSSANARYRRGLLGSAVDVDLTRRHRLLGPHFFGHLNEREGRDQDRRFWRSSIGRDGGRAGRPFDGAGG